MKKVFIMVYVIVLVLVTGIFSVSAMAAQGKGDETVVTKSMGHYLVYYVYDDEHQSYVHCNDIPECDAGEFVLDLVYNCATSKDEHGCTYHVFLNKSIGVDILYSWSDCQPSPD